MAVWQGLEHDSNSGGNTRWLIIFIGIVALSMLTQAIVVIFLAVEAKRVQARLLTIAEDLHTKAIPLLKQAQDLSEEAIPKVKTITENLLQTSTIVRAKAQQFDATLTDVNTRTKAQVVRLDGMISTGLTATGTLAAMIHQGIKTPVIEAIAIVNGLKAGIDVLMGKAGAVGPRDLLRKSKAITLYKGDEDGI